MKEHIEIHRRLRDKQVQFVSRILPRLQSLNDLCRGFPIPRFDKRILRSAFTRKHGLPRNSGETFPFRHFDLSALDDVVALKLCRFFDVDLLGYPRERYFLARLLIRDVNVGDLRATAKHTDGERSPDTGKP